MKSAKVLTNVTNNAPQILTALRAQMVAENPSFDNRLPQVTQDNIREFGTAVLDYQPTQNAFVITSDKMDDISNAFKDFKRDYVIHVLTGRDAVRKHVEDLKDDDFDDIKDETEKIKSIFNEEVIEK